MIATNHIPPVTISGSGKYILVTATKDGKSMELIRGGSEFKMHKDITAALESELGEAGTIHVRGGGMILFTESTEGEHKMIVVSGESLKYGPPDSIIAVLSLLEAAYPAYDILSK